MKGYKHTEEAKIKIGLASIGRKPMLGKKQSLETLMKRSISMKGKNTWMKGRKLSEETKRKMSEVRKGRIVSEETRDKISKANKGNKNCLGRRLSNEIKEKIRKSLIGQSFSDERKGKISIALKGKKFSKERKEKLRALNLKPMLGKHHSEETKNKLKLYRGKNTSNWKGGITPITKLIRKSFRYNQWRMNIFIRDKFVCQKCGIKNVYLEAHHEKKKFNKLIEEVKYFIPLLSLYDGAMLYEPLWDIDNGITLCKNCHLKMKRK